MEEVIVRVCGDPQIIKDVVQKADFNLKSPNLIGFWLRSLMLSYKVVLLLFSIFLSSDGKVFMEGFFFISGLQITITFHILSLIDFVE